MGKGNFTEDFKLDAIKQPRRELTTTGATTRTKDAEI